jgi:hypothetical protein
MNISPHILLKCLTVAIDKLDPKMSDLKGIKWQKVITKG